MSCQWNWPSAKWWKFDFHTHTPASADYGKGTHSELHKNIEPKQWLLNYMKAGVDCVAITDHNSGAWIDLLKYSLDELFITKDPDYRPLCLFPGVEITVQGNIHILAIFPPSKTTSDIDSLLGVVKYQSTKGKSDGCSISSAVEVIDEIIKSGGLAIPAHVDKPCGLFIEYSGNTLSQLLNHKDILAMEVVDTSNNKPDLYISKKLNWVEVIGTDSHHPDGVNGQRYPGSHFTWVKMSNPSFEGLRLALVDGNLSLKRSDAFSGDPNAHGSLAIESIFIDNAKYIGRGDLFICPLNPWLNTIIGGRGTGKSTILEFLRTGLGRKDEIPGSLEREFVKYSQTSASRQDEGLLKESTIITVDLRKDGNHYRIKWSNLDKKYLIEEETGPDVWSPALGDIAQRFPIRIYSQKQIFELAKHPQALLQVIDDAPEVNYRDWKLEWDELVSMYLSIRAQEREMQVGLQEEPVIKGQLEDIKRKLEVFEKSGHADILRAYQLGKNQHKAIELWEKSWIGIAQQIRTFAKILLPPEIDIQNFSLEKAEDHELLEVISGVRSFFQTIQVEIEQIAMKVDKIKEFWDTKKSDLIIFQKIAETDDSYKILLGELLKVGTDDPASYANLVKRRQELEEKLDNFRVKRESLTQYQQNAEDCLSKIERHREKIIKLRENFLNNVLINNLYVQINVIPYGNTLTVEEELRNLIGRGNGGFERDIGAVDENEGLLALLKRDSSQTMLQRVGTLKSTLLGIYARDSTAISSAKDRRFVSHVQGLSPEQIDRIRCWFPADSLDVRYSLKGGDSFKPVEQGSPGQKTAALLAFILSYGDEPLILDQPEDDLDNSLIYDLIVMQLRKIKQRRQVLIITHNANIVVNGDAENIIVLDVIGGQTRIITQGSLQEDSIRNEICRIMEGGKEAFEQRYKRISRQ